MKQKIKSTLKNKNFQRIIVLLFACITSLSLYLKLDIIPDSAVMSYETIFLKRMAKIVLSFWPLNIITFILTYILYLFYQTIYFQKKREKKRYPVLLSILFSFFLVFGYSFLRTNSWNLIFYSAFQMMKALFQFSGYFLLFYALITYLFEQLENYTISKEKTSKYLSLIFDKHPILLCGIFLLIIWLPYLIITYPGTIMWDAGNQIKQYFGVENYTSTTVLLLKENVLMTNHHSAFCTFLIGICIQFGKMLGSDNLGIFIFTLLQVIGFILILSYSISYMRKCRVPYGICILVLLFYGFNPIFPCWAITVGKDTIASYLVLLYILMLTNLLRNPELIKKIPFQLAILFCMILCSLFRNNGVYTIILSFPFLFFALKEYRKQLGIIFITFLILFGGYTKILLPTLYIPEGSKREMLSIPFQQTARLVTEKKISKYDKKVINRVLDYQTIKEKYNPELSDPVKNTYHVDTTSKELKDYFKVWFKYLIRYPDIYIQATMNNVYGYFYPNTLGKKEYIHWGITSNIQDTDVVHFEANPEYKDISQNIIVTIHMLRRLPLVGIFMSGGGYSWILLLLIGYLCYIKRLKEIIILLPLIITLLVCIASPVNTYLRYMLPIIFSTPFVLTYIITLKKKGSKK